LVGGIVGVLAGHFIVAHFGGNMYFYSNYGYAHGQGAWASTIDTLTRLYRFVGRLLALGLVGMFVTNLGVLRSEEMDWQEQAAIAWLAISHILLLSVVLQVVGHAHAFLYALPLLFLLAVSPVPWRKAPLVSKAAIAFAIIVFVVAALLGSRYAWRNCQYAQRQSPEARDRKDLNVTLARAVTNQGERLIWNAYYDEHAWIPTLEAFYRFGGLPLPAGGPNFFTVHESQFRAAYPGLTPDELSRSVYDNTSQWVDVAVVFDDPAAADTRFDNDYSRAVARYVAQAIRNDARWKRVFTVESARYGTLAGYRNLAAHNRGAYDRRLQGQNLIQP